MFKIVFNDSTELLVEQVPMPENISVKGVSTKCLHYKLSTAEFPTLESIKEYFSDETKTSKVEVFCIMDDDETVAEGTYENMTKIQRVAVEEDIVHVYLVAVSTIPEKIADLEDRLDAAVKNASEVKAVQDETVSAVKEDVAAVKVEVAEVKASIPVKKTRDQMTLEEYKEYKISESKANLAAWLEVTTVKSSVHGGVEEEYSITATKQQQLTAMIFLAQTNEEFVPSWNATGKACTYDWTLDELLQLAFEIQAVVRPMVSKQQKMEEDINAATSKDAVDEVVITF